KNIELILVNDGSKDNSLNLCYEIAKKDCNRVKYAVGAKKKIDRHNSVSAGFLFDDKLKSNIYYVQIGYNYKF
ncbi:MAG: hypothetical protein UE068_15325, partial [Paludibacteraceae bacterium]|nr:hypothetical protein [Paludibacteraceae bacterium]